MPELDNEQLLTFMIGRDEYGISILRVREIAEYRTLTPVPMRPAWMRGVVNLRGSVVPVVDLAAKLGLAQTIVTRLTCLIIVDVETDGDRTVVAVMVDAVRRVVQIAQQDIQEPPAFGMPADVVPGMVHIDGELIILLDLHAIVADDASVERWASAHRGAGEESSSGEVADARL
jgi:purine-binding chemotaxis protein CheW